MTLRIAVLDDYQGVALDYGAFSTLDAEVTVFRDTVTGETLIDRLQPFDVVCLMRERTPFPAVVIDALANLKLIVTTGPKNAAIDLTAASARGIPVCGTASRGPATVHLALSLILSATRGLIAEAVSVRDGGWQIGLGRDLNDLTLGIVGLGRIGSEIARLCQALGMSVMAWSPNLTNERCAEQGVARADSLHALLSVSDVVSVHVVLNDGTDGLIGAAQLAMMKPDAVLVNTSRGPVVPWQPVLDALRADRLGVAAIDVYDKEPLAADHPIRDRDLIDSGRLVLTPHIGYVARQTWETFYTETVEDILAWLDGAPIRLLKP